PSLATKTRKPANKTTSKSQARKKSSTRRPPSPAAQAAMARRAQRMRKTFVASAELRPMAQQLLQARAPAAYSGIEAWARRHSADEAGALAYFVLGYAHFLDRD